MSHEAGLFSPVAVVGIDSTLPDNFGRSVAYTLSAATTFATITYVGGVPFLIATFVFATLYYSGMWRWHYTWYSP